MTILVMIGSLCIGFFSPAQAYRKFCSITHDYMRPEQGKNPFKQTLDKITPGRVAKADYSYTRGSMSCYVMLSGKERKRLGAVLSNEEPTVYVADLIGRLTREKSKSLDIVANVATDYKASNEKATVGDIMAALKL